MEKALVQLTEAACRSSHGQHLSRQQHLQQLRLHLKPTQPLHPAPPPSPSR